LKTICAPAQWAQYLPVALRSVPPDVRAGVIADVPGLEITEAAAA